MAMSLELVDARSEISKAGKVGKAGGDSEVPKIRTPFLWMEGPSQRFRRKLDVACASRLTLEHPCDG